MKVLLIVLVILICIAVGISFYLATLRIQNIKGFRPFKVYNKDLFSPASKKSNILVLQDGAYKSFPEYGTIGSEINKAYCKKWGYEYKLITYDDLGILPPYWLKVKDVKELLPKYDAVLYVDMDAIFTDFDTSIDSVLEYIDKKKGKSFDLYVGMDKILQYSINSGVFLVRNTSFGNEFMASWLATCLDTKGQIVNKCAQWEYDKDTEKWSCPGCLFGGFEYEQGILDYLVNLYPDNVIRLSSLFFSNPDTDRASFILHLMGKKNKEDIVNVFKEVKNRLNI